MKALLLKYASLFLFSVSLFSCSESSKNAQADSKQKQPVIKTPKKKLRRGMKGKIVINARPKPVPKELKGIEKKLWVANEKLRLAHAAIKSEAGADMVLYRQILRRKSKFLKELETERFNLYKAFLNEKQSPIRTTVTAQTPTESERKFTK